jgi:hypothetical protein
MKRFLLNKNFCNLKRKQFFLRTSARSTLTKINSSFFSPVVFDTTFFGKIYNKIHTEHLGEFACSALRA